MAKDLKAEVHLPYILRDVTLFVPGTHNGVPYSRDDVNRAFSATNWSDHRITALYLDHSDDWGTDPRTGRKTVQKGADVRDYVGQVINVHMEDGRIVGDMEVVDEPTAIKLAYGKAKFGVSPAGQWRYMQNGTGKEFMFRNFAVVVNPAQKEAYIHHAAMSSLEGMQLPYHNFAMSQEVNKMTDWESVKSELADVIDGKLTPLAKQVESLSAEVGQLKKEKKEEYPKPEMAKKDEEKKEDEKAMKEKKECYPEEKKAEDKEDEKKEEEAKKKDEDEEDMSKLFSEIIQNSAYTEHIKKEMAKGKSMKEAAKSWKSEKNSSEIEAMKAKIEQLESRFNDVPAPSRVVVNANGQAQEEAELSQREVAKGFAAWVCQLGTGI